jgi:hypothetical protein
MQLRRHPPWFALTAPVNPPVRHRLPVRHSGISGCDGTAVQESTLGIRAPLSRRVESSRVESSRNASQTVPFPIRNPLISLGSAGQSGESLIEHHRRQLHAQFADRLGRRPLGPGGGQHRVRMVEAWSWARRAPLASRMVADARGEPGRDARQGPQMADQDALEQTAVPSALVRAQAGPGIEKGVE